jgi:hypothetical protein
LSLLRRFRVVSVSREEEERELALAEEVGKGGLNGNGEETSSLEMGEEGKGKAGVRRGEGGREEHEEEETDGWLREGGRGKRGQGE